MMRTNIVCNLIVFFFSIQICNAQQSDYNLSQLKQHCNSKLNSQIGLVKETGDGLFLPFKLLYNVYRSTISEQFSSDCVFDLSCSRFAKNAISYHGLIKGGLLGFDRLTRCHSFLSLETVPIYFNQKTGKIIDDPKMY